MQKNYELDKLIDRIFENLENKGLKFSKDEKEGIKQQLTTALNEAYPRGISQTELLSDDFKKRLHLAFSMAALTQKNPFNLNFKFCLEKVFKSDEKISDDELKHAFKKIFTELNKLSPKPLPDNKLDELVDDMMKSTKMSPLDLLDKMLEEKLAFDLIFETIANETGGQTPIPGYVMYNAVQVLRGNAAGIALDAPAFQAAGTLWDQVLPSPNEMPWIEARMMSLKAGLGITEAINEETSKLAYAPPPP
ncbi:MAG: hypothetical protein ACYCQI_11355 [Gammaproteobacteria bacterium]